MTIQRAQRQASGVNEFKPARAIVEDGIDGIDGLYGHELSSCYRWLDFVLETSYPWSNRSTPSSGSSQT
jgi:hypothetical protein